jgi:hypothetical protein
MSEDTNAQTAVEKEQKVVISPEDCNAALDFWRHFNIPIPSNLQSAMDTFAQDPSFTNQEKVKLEICRAIAQTDHEAFKDDMFKKISEECEGVTFEMQFDKDFEEEVTEKE